MELESWQQCVTLHLVGAEHDLYAMRDFCNLIGAANILAAVIKSGSESLYTVHDCIYMHLELMLRDNLVQPSLNP